MEPEITPIAPNQCFQFDCHPGVPCFNACCRDLNQILTPYEIYRLKSHLNMDSGTFLAHYTHSHMGPATGLPIIALKPAPGDDHPCPFVSPEGCRVYADRPASCRIYPLMRGLRMDPESGELSVHYALLKESHCRGFAQQRSQSVAQWIRNQALAPYTAMDDLMAAIISKKRRKLSGPLDLRRSHLFRLALYDLDNFHEQVFTKGLLDRFPIDTQIFEAARLNELQLLKLGFHWISQTLFTPQGP